MIIQRLRKGSHRNNSYCLTDTLYGRPCGLLHMDNIVTISNHSSILVTDVDTNQLPVWLPKYFNLFPAFKRSSLSQKVTRESLSISFTQSEGNVDVFINAKLMFSCT